MANLPTETMEEILVKLAVKDLLRFKCVCKDWLSLITSQRFINRHCSDKSKQPCQLLRLYPIYDDEEHHFYCFYPMFDDNRRFLRLEEVNFHQHLPPRNHVVSDLMGPINGVFCIRFISDDLALSNPAMRELRPLPRPPFEYGGPNLYLFDKDFREDRSPKTPYVYNSITDSWKAIETQIYFSIKSLEHYAFVNGVYYWFVDYDDTNFGILAFDMRSDKFYQIKIPECIGVSPRVQLRIVGHGDSMALHLQKSIGCRHGFSGNKCVGEIWQLDGRSMALDLCTPLGHHEFVGELWKMKKEGFWSRAWRDEADWILPLHWRWVKANKGGVVKFGVVSDHVYKESLVSIKREGEGEDDSIQAFLQQIEIFGNEE